MVDIRQCTATIRNLPKVVKEAPQWRSERPGQVESNVNQTELTTELNLQCNNFTLVERYLRSTNDRIGENC